MFTSNKSKTIFKNLVTFTFKDNQLEDKYLTQSFSFIIYFFFIITMFFISIICMSLSVAFMFFEYLIIESLFQVIIISSCGLLLLISWLLLMYYKTNNKFINIINSFIISLVLYYICEHLKFMTFEMYKYSNKICLNNNNNNQLQYNTLDLICNNSNINNKSINSSGLFYIDFIHIIIRLITIIYLNRFFLSNLILTSTFIPLYIIYFKDYYINPHNEEVFFITFLCITLVFSYINDSSCRSSFHKKIIENNDLRKKLNIMENVKSGYIYIDTNTNLVYYNKFYERTQVNKLLYGYNINDIKNTIYDKNKELENVDNNNKLSYLLTKLIKCFLSTKKKNKLQLNLINNNNNKQDLEAKNKSIKKSILKNNNDNVNKRNISLKVYNSNSILKDKNNNKDNNANKYDLNFENNKADNKLNIKFILNSIFLNCDRINSHDFDGEFKKTLLECYDENINNNNNSNYRSNKSKYNYNVLNKITETLNENNITENNYNNNNININNNNKINNKLHLKTDIDNNKKITNIYNNYKELADYSFHNNNIKQEITISNMNLMNTKSNFFKKRSSLENYKDSYVNTKDILSLKSLKKIIQSLINYPEDIVDFNYITSKRIVANNKELYNFSTLVRYDEHSGIIEFLINENKTKNKMNIKSVNNTTNNLLINNNKNNKYLDITDNNINTNDNNNYTTQNFEDNKIYKKKNKNNHIIKYEHKLNCFLKEIKNIVNQYYNNCCQMLFRNISNNQDNNFIDINYFDKQENNDNINKTHDKNIKLQKNRIEGLFYYFILYFNDFKFNNNILFKNKDFNKRYNNKVNLSDIFTVLVNAVLTKSKLHKKHFKIECSVSPNLPKNLFVDNNKLTLLLFYLLNYLTNKYNKGDILINVDFKSNRRNVFDINIVDNFSDIDVNIINLVNKLSSKELFEYLTITAAAANDSNALYSNSITYSNDVLPNKTTNNLHVSSITENDLNKTNIKTNMIMTNEKTYKSLIKFNNNNYYSNCWDILDILSCYAKVKKLIEILNGGFMLVKLNTNQQTTVLKTVISLNLQEKDEYNICNESLNNSNFTNNTKNSCLFKLDYNETNESEITRKSLDEQTDKDKLDVVKETEVLFNLKKTSIDSNNVVSDNNNNNNNLNKEVLNIILAFNNEEERLLIKTYITNNSLNKNVLINFIEVSDGAEVISNLYYCFKNNLYIDVIIYDEYMSFISGFTLAEILSLLIKQSVIPKNMKLVLLSDLIEIKNIKDTKVIYKNLDCIEDMGICKSVFS